MRVEQFGTDFQYHISQHMMAAHHIHHLHGLLQVAGHAERHVAEVAPVPLRVEHTLPIRLLAGRERAGVRRRGIAPGLFLPPAIFLSIH